MVLDQQEGLGELDEEVRKKVREALLKQHHHQNHKKLANRIPIVRSFADMGKKQSDLNSVDKNGMAYPKGFAVPFFLSQFSFCAYVTQRLDCKLMLVLHKAYQE